MSDRQENGSDKAEAFIHCIPEESKEKLLGLLGFAARARKLVCGTDMCRDEIRRGKLSFVLVASDASANTQKRITDACRYYSADICRIPVTSDLLSSRIGKSAATMVVGITDINFINGIAALIGDETH